MPTEDLIAGLQERRDAAAAEVAALDAALAALNGNPTTHLLASAGRRVAIGDDKLEAVRKYIAKHGKVRQADITHATGFNSGTVSQATTALMLDGVIEKGPKEDRSTTWLMK